MTQTTENHNLARYNHTQSKQAKSYSVKHDADLGTLTLMYLVIQRRPTSTLFPYASLFQYLARYKQPKSKQAKSSSVKHDADIGTLTPKQYVTVKRESKKD